MPVLRVKDRLRLRQLYAFRCGYCGISETEVGSTLTEDHFQPIIHGGSDDFDNIVYACHTCNSFKGDTWNPAQPERILHPLHDNVTDHLRLEADGTLVALTATGIFHLVMLNLNRPFLIAYRLEKQAIFSRDEQIAELKREVGEIRSLLSEILNRLPPR